MSRAATGIVAMAAVLCGALAVAAPPRHHGGPPPPAPELQRPFGHDPAPSTYQPLPRTDTIIVNAIVLDGAGNRFDGAEVLIKAGQVAAVGRALDRSGAQLIDAGGRWLTPGIIDPHSHDGTYVVPLTEMDDHSSDVTELGAVDDSGVWIEHGINPQDVSLRRALEGGVTTLQVLPGSAPVFGGRTAVIKTVPGMTAQAIKFPGARHGLKMACGENPKRFGAGKPGGPTSRAGVIAVMRAAFEDAREHIAHHKRGERKRKPGGETLAAVMSGEIDVQAHCYRADDMAQMISLAREYGFRIAAFHHAVEAYKIPQLLKNADVCAAVWSDWWGFKLEAQDAIRENAAFLDAQGVCVAMHSDSPQIGQRLNIEAAKAAAAGRRAGLTLPPERVIRWITSNAARTLGLADRIGTLAPGYNADLVLWSGDPFSIYTKADMVMIDGAIAYDRHDPRRQPISDFELGRAGVRRPR